MVIVACASSSQYGLAAQFGPTITPVITGVAPSSFVSGINTPVTITGSNLENITAVMLGETALTGIEALDAGQLTARVPWSIAPGEYDLTVTNTAGESGLLPGAVTIAPAATGWATNGPYGGALHRALR